MTVCPFCSNKNPSGIHICLNCASSLIQVCAQCGASTSINRSFCEKCGESFGRDREADYDPSQLSKVDLQERMLRDLRSKMPSSLIEKFSKASKDLYGQKREVSVLFAEISYTSIDIDEIDNESVFIAVDKIVHQLSDVVYKYEGTIDKYSDNGIMALFGIPINHENDPERTVRAALEMQRMVRQIHEQFIDRFNLDFKLHIGINTGSVISGRLRDNNHVEYTVIGNTVELASNLVKNAGPGNILVSFETYQRSYPIIDYQSVLESEAIGFTGQLRAFQPLGIRLNIGRIRGLPGLQVPMVGRTEQFDNLRAKFSQVIDKNSSRIVLCSGEAGIGKSRLVAEFRKQISEDLSEFAQGTCASYMRIVPYRVVADILRNLLSISEFSEPSEQIASITRRLNDLNLDRNEILPYLLHVLGILHSDQVLEVRIKLLEPEMLLRQTHFALRSFFIAEARRKPLILVFDDLHWVDQATSQFLEYFCQSLEDYPILLILVARDFDLYGFTQSINNAAWKHISKPLDLSIQPLSEADALLLVDKMIQENTETARELKNLITSRAAGNPYFTEELVRILIDHDRLKSNQGQSIVAENAAHMLHEIPGTLVDIILARSDNLSEDIKKVLFHAVILGPTFSAKLLRSLIDKDEEFISNSLKELESRDFLIHTKFGDDDGYIFKHPLLQETIYKTLLKSDLKRLHTNVSQLIESGDYWLPGERNQILAYHHSESAEPSKAIPYLMISAQNAYQHFANDTVVQLYKQALSLMEITGVSEPGQKESAQVGLAQALKFTGELEESANILLEIVETIPVRDSDPQDDDLSLIQIQTEAMRELADIRAREGDLDIAIQYLQKGMDMLGEAGRQNSPHIWRRLIDRLAWVNFQKRNLIEAHNLADLALLDSPTSEAEDPITLASLYNTIGGIYWTQSRYSDAIESVEHSLEIYKSLHYQWGVANSLTNLGVLHFSTEKWVQAINYLEQADRLRSEYGDDPERPINLKNLGEVLIDIGELRNAREKLFSSKEISQRLGLTIAQIHAEFGLCRVSTVENDLPKAWEHLDKAGSLIENFDEISINVANYYLLKAQLEIKENDLQNARNSAKDAFGIVQKGDMADKQVEALRILGEISTKLDEYEQAEKYLYQSITLAQKLSDRFSEAKTRTKIGELFYLWSQENQSERIHYLDQAERSLDTAIRIFETLGAIPNLQDAKTIRAQIFTERKDSRSPSELSEKKVDLMYSEDDVPDGEWSQTTVLSVLLFPYQGMDEEFVFETIAFLIPTLTDMIEENGGYVLHQQDGITAVFGVPTAHENDPELAVESVMQIVNFYNGLNSETELPISIHLGVTMGRVVSGKVDLADIDDLLITGEPIKLARSIAEASPSGRVWVTQPVRNRTSFRFQYTPVSSDLVEKNDQQLIYQLEGLLEQILPVRGLIGLKSPFIGRQSEFETMRKMSEILENDKGGVIWLDGDAGIGKSRLMREFADRIVESDVLVLNGGCTARRSEYAFSLFSDLLMQAFDIQQYISASHVKDNIDKKLNTLGSDLNDLRPFFQFILGVHPSRIQGIQLSSMEPEQLRRQIFVAIHRLISTLASNQPVALFLDDLQWIDSISADLLLYLSHLVTTQRVLFVCAQRQKEISPYEEILERTRTMHPEQYVHLSLNPLTINECRQLLGEFLSSADLPDSILSLIVQQSGGNPYYIEEFVRLLVEKDYLQLVRGKLIANHTLDADTLVIPASLESLIRSRVDSLETSARQLLQVASVIGHRFDEDLLRHVASMDDVDVLLALLQSRGMINPTLEVGHWEISHPLIEVIVYNTVLRAQRRILHGRTAEGLEIQWAGSEDEHAEDLAYHFGKAEKYKKALHYLILSGERAAARHANEVAVTYFEQASELLAAVSDVSDESRWRIIRGMGEVYQFIGNFEASLAVLQNGLDLLESPDISSTQIAGIFRRMGDTAHKIGDQEQAISYLEKALELIGDPKDSLAQVEAALIYARLGWCQFMLSDLDNAKATIMESMDFARMANSITTLAMVENYLGGILYRQGDLEGAMSHTRTAMSYWQKMGYSWGVAAALSNLGVLESVSGNWQAAFDSVKRSLRLRQEMGDVDGVAITNHNLGHLARDQGDVALAETYYRDSLAISVPLQMNHNAANSFIGLALSLHYQHKSNEARNYLEQGLLLAKEINAPDVIVEALCTTAEIFLASGEYKESEESSREAEKLAKTIGLSPLVSTAIRLTATSLLHQGEFQDAGVMLKDAWESLGEGQENLEGGRLHSLEMEYARLKGDKNNFEFHRNAAKQIFTQLGASRDLDELEALTYK